MSTSKIVKTNKRSIVALKLPVSVPALIAYSQQIVKAMTGNPAFPTPAPTLAAVTAAIDDLQAAESAAISRVKGAVLTRNEKKTALVMLLEQLRRTSRRRRTRTWRAEPPSSRAPASA